MAITLTLPWPSSHLLPNHTLGKSYHTFSGEKRIARETAFVIAKENKLRLTRKNKVKLSMTFHPPDRRRRDLDGLLSACKPSLDGICLALEFDDSAFDPIVLRRGEVVKDGKVEVVIGGWR